jgi:histone H3/H4
VAAASAVTELAKELSEDVLGESVEFAKVIESLLQITKTKAYFNNKEVIIQRFTELIVELMPQTGSDALKIRHEFLQACLPQIGNPAVETAYKNQLISSAG